MPVGLVVALGRRRVAEAPQVWRLGPNTRSSSARRCGLWTVAISSRRPAPCWAAGARRPSSRSSSSYSSGSAAPQRAHGELRAVARVHRVAAATATGAPGSHTGTSSATSLADQRDDGARAVAEHQPQVLAVAVRAQLALADEQHLLDVLAVDELANQHGTQR